MMDLEIWLATPIEVEMESSRGHRTLMVGLSGQQDFSHSGITVCCSKAKGKMCETFGDHKQVSSFTAIYLLQI